MSCQDTGFKSINTSGLKTWTCWGTSSKRNAECSYVKLRTHSARNSQLLRQIDVGTVCILFNYLNSLPVAGTCITWPNMCTLHLESEISGTWNQDRQKKKSFVSYCTDLPSFPVRSLWCSCWDRWCIWYWSSMLDKVVLLFQWTKNKLNRLCRPYIQLLPSTLLNILIKPGKRENINSWVNSGTKCYRNR